MDQNENHTANEYLLQNLLKFVLFWQGYADY